MPLDSPVACMEETTAAAQLSEISEELARSQQRIAVLEEVRSTATYLCRLSLLSPLPMPKTGPCVQVLRQLLDCLRAANGQDNLEVSARR